MESSTEKGNAFGLGMLEIAKCDFVHGERLRQILVAHGSSQALLAVADLKLPKLVSRVVALLKLLHPPEEWAL